MDGAKLEGQKVAVLIDCVDPRFARVRPAANWFYKQMGYDPYVVTTHGPVTAFAELSGIEERVRSSFSFINSLSEVDVLVIVAHDDCKANPKPKEVQVGQLLEVALTVRQSHPAQIILLYANELEDNKWEVELVQDIPAAFVRSTQPGG